MDAQNRQLSDAELESVGGGVSSEAIIKAINAGWPKLPQNIRVMIIEVYKTYGKEAAKELTLKLATGNLEYMKKIADLFD